MVRDDISPAIATRVRQLLLDLHQQPEGRAILEGMATQAFYAADNQSYRTVEELIRHFERDVRKVEQP